MTPRQKIDSLIYQCNMLDLTASAARLLSEERLRKWDETNRSNFLKCVYRLSDLETMPYLNIPSFVNPEYLRQMDIFLVAVISAARSNIKVLELLDITETF